MKCCLTSWWSWWWASWHPASHPAASWLPDIPHASRCSEGWLSSEHTPSRRKSNSSFKCEVTWNTDTTDAPREIFCLLPAPSGGQAHFRAAALELGRIQWPSSFDMGVRCSRLCLRESTTIHGVQMTETARKRKKCKFSCTSAAALLKLLSVWFHDALSHFSM